MNNQNSSDEEERHKKRGDLQREMIMLESDLKKTMNEKTVIDAEERKLGKEIDRLRMELQDNQKKKHLLEQDINVRHEQIGRLKKQLNSA